jgi:uncharacterized membrane protein YoaT (DUF817 family)
MWRDQLHQKAVAIEVFFGPFIRKNQYTLYLYEFITFGIKMAWASLFGAAMLAALIVTHFFYPDDAWLYRYDFLTFFAVSVQVIMLATKLETKEEAFVIFLFHIVGTCMEIFKTSMGSWVYPEPSVMHIYGVPLFTGFMYASVGSYIARSWRLLDFKFTAHPSRIVCALIAIGIYVNFFTHHFILDLRYVLFAVIALAFGRTMLYFKVWKEYRKMPLLLGFFLVSFFIWIAENVGTFTAAWVYPSQQQGWHLVSLGKLGSWFLLMIISYVLVSLVHKVETISTKF